MKKIAIIGCGTMGVHLAELVSSIAEVEITAVCDLVQSRAEALADICGARAFVSHTELITESSPDIAVVSLPPYSRTAIEYDLARAKIPFVTENPVSSEISAARGIAELIRESGLKTASFSPLTCGKAYKILSQFVRKNHPTHVRADVITSTPDKFWKQDDELSGGILFEKGLDVLALLMFLIGKPKVSYTLSTRGHAADIPDYNTDDVFTALIKSECGAIAEILLSNCGTAEENITEITVTAFEKKAVYKNGFIKIYGEEFDIGKTKKMRHAGEILPDEISDGCLIYDCTDDEREFFERFFASLDGRIEKNPHDNIPDSPEITYENALDILDFAEKILK